MRGIDVIRLSTRNFRSNKLRTFLTILAVSVATAAILFLVSFGYGLQLLTIQSIANSATVATVDVIPLSQKSLIKLDELAIERIKKVPNVLTVAPELDLEAQAKVTSIGSTVVHAITPRYFELADIRLAKGAIFADKETHKAVVSTGFLAQFSLASSETVLGKAFGLTYKIGTGEETAERQKSVDDPKQFTIVGVVSDDDVSYLFVPLADVQELVKEVPYANFKVLVNDRENVLEVKDSINALGYDASAPLETLKQLDQVFAIVQITLGALGIIALIISSIGMFNTMTISLLERTREIGIMRALGADRLDIWKLFLSEATMIGFFGGIAGVLLGTGLSYMANSALNFLAALYGGQEVTIFYSPPWFVIAIIIFSTIVGTITGFYPARRASQLNPLKALRYE